MILYILQWYSPRTKMWVITSIHEEIKVIDDAFNEGVKRMPNLRWQVLKRTTEELYTSDDVNKS